MFLSLYFVNTILPLSNEQLIIINKGLKFIPPCQSHFFYRQPTEKIIEREYQRLYNDNVKNLFNYAYPEKDQRATDYFTSIKNLLQQLYTKPLPKQLKACARYIYFTIKSIQRCLRKANVVVGQTDKSKLFFFMNAQEYEEKIQNYMTKTNAYEEITSGICPLADDLHAVLTLLDYLLINDRITKEQYKEMYPDLTKLELAHIYFNLKVHKPDISVRPIIASINAPARLISSFLEQLLTPIYNEVTKDFTFINDGHLTSTTLFLIFDVSDLYTMIPRDRALVVLGRFCTKYGKDRKIGNLNIDTIIRLVRIVLDTNSFAYKDKYYRQIKGGAMGSPFTMVLANIYMFEWEQDLIQHQITHHEIYGRYIDDVFMTTNLPKEKILEELDKTIIKDSNIQISTTITSEPYILPYESNHPRHIHANIPYNALVRATRLCSSVEDFDMERLSTEMILLVNGYPPKFIQYHMKNFFKKFDAMTVWTDLDCEAYQQLHHTLLNKPTRREKQQNSGKSNHQSIRKKKNSEQKNQIYVHYTFENGSLLAFKKEYRQLWKKFYVYPGSRFKNTRLILGKILNRTLQSFLIHKKPRRQILTRMQPTTEAAQKTAMERCRH
ncbi:unnamed protein product [Rotaria sordida]|uniref:Reverse transcriptase domain-containing protein n=1 Tax=Rotaria sordida TaxID=392033 RepID=A0A819NA64_9BILA|nr:unnamed protein product [Rotaria sordida]CAF3992377.1 unnamed protein product [Rotaria sordida]